MPLATLLMIDDDEDDQFIARYVVAKHSTAIEFLSVYDGAEALSFLRTRTPDAIMLDINMPGMDGLEFLEAYARDFDRHAPVVAMLTNSIHDADRERALHFGFVRGFFRKPLTVENVAEMEAMIDGASSALT